MNRITDKDKIAYRNKLKRIAVIAFFAAIVITASQLYGKGSGNIDGAKLINGFTDADGQQVMLVEYSKQTVATVGGDGFAKTILYQNTDGSCEVHFVSSNDGDEKETRTAYSVDSAVIGEVYDIINSSSMSAWNGKYSGTGLDGAVYSLTFRTNDGGYVRASSDNMPEDGISIMDSVCSVMESYALKGTEISR